MEINYCAPAAFNALLFLHRERTLKKRISWRAVGLGMVIAGFAQKDTGEAWPSRAVLEAITGIESRDIPRVTAELKDAGFLVIEEREGRSNTYRLTYGEIAACGCLAAVGEQPPTCGDLAAKPMGKQPPITIYKNNKVTIDQQGELFPEEPKSENPAPETTGAEPGDTSATPQKEPVQSKAKAASKTPSKPKTKKQYPGDLDADAEKLVALYAELIKPRRLDNSGSRKRFLETTKNLLKGGIPIGDLEASIQNYRKVIDSTERDADPKYRKGFQSFFGPRDEVWKDYLSVDVKSTDRAAANHSAEDADPLWLQYHVERVEAQYGEAIAREFDAIGRKRKSIQAAKEWLKKETECQTA